MKYIKKYRIFESKDNEVIIHDILNIMQDLIDLGHEIAFNSNTGKISPSDIYNKNKDLIDTFNPINKVGNIMKSKFSILFTSEDKDYKEFSSIIEEMNIPISRFSDIGWSMSNLEFEKGTLYTKGQKIIFFDSIEFTFTKPDIEIDEEYTPPSKSVIDAIMRNISLAVDDIYYIEPTDNNYGEVIVNFYSNNYNGSLPKNIDDKFEKICEELGFKEFTYNNGEFKIVFYY